MESCFVQQISENGQKVKIETLLNIDKNSFFLARNMGRADFLDLETDCSCRPHKIQKFLVYQSLQ